MPSVRKDVNDSYGRTFPGNPAESKGKQWVQCWDKDVSSIVKIVDNCPTAQAGAGGEGGGGGGGGGEGGGRGGGGGGDTRAPLSQRPAEG